MTGTKRILVSWHTDPRYIPPFVLSQQQCTVGPKLNSDQPLLNYAGWTPRGTHDLKEALDSLGVDGDFDAVVVWADAGGDNLPLNLEAFSCPKVLCVGDTHHLQSPLRKMIDYATRANYDFILSSHNRHHLHWFAEAGARNLAWLPGLKVRHTPRPFQSARTAQVAFVGSAGKSYPRRTRLLFELNRAVPLAAMAGRREHAADVAASSLVSFNASLNGDLNLRVFETLSAAGCLLTDRLSRDAGLDLILKEDEEYVGYDTPEECVDKARFLLKHPEAALRIAQAGHRTFVERMLPGQRISELFGWIFHGRLDELYRAPPRGAPVRDPVLAERVRVYEELQELQRTMIVPRVLFTSEVPDICLFDALDLRQLRISIGELADSPTSSRIDGIARHCSVVSRAQIENTSWDALVTRDATAVPRTVRYCRLITV